MSPNSTGDIKELRILDSVVVREMGGSAYMVLSKVIRDRMGAEKGDRIEVLEAPGGADVILRKRTTAPVNPSGAV